MATAVGEESTFSSEIPQAERAKIQSNKQGKKARILGLKEL